MQYSLVRLRHGLQRLNLNNQQSQAGFIMATLVSFIGIVLLLGAVVLMTSVQAQRVALKQNYVQQAQLASTAALDYGKEQYELDINYQNSGGEIDFANDGRIRTTIEIESLGYTNAVNTQQKMRGIGRVYDAASNELLSQREIVGRIIRDAGGGRSERFIFIVDNSGSMTTSEWNQSKGTVDSAIEYVIDNVATAEVAVVQYGTNNSSNIHKYDVSVPFTSDRATATNFLRRYGTGTTAPNDFQDYLPGSLARMRDEGVYGPGAELDLENATNIQYVMFTDARGDFGSACCSSLVQPSSTSFDTDNNNAFVTEDGYGEINAIKDGTVFAEHGYPGLESQWTILNVYGSNAYNTQSVSAAIASPGGTWTGSIGSNPDDPEGDGILPRRFIDTTLSAGPTEILEILQEIFDYDLNI